MKAANTQNHRLGVQGHLRRGRSVDAILSPVRQTISGEQYMSSSYSDSHLEAAHQDDVMQKYEALRRKSSSEYDYPERKTILSAAEHLEALSFGLGGVIPQEERQEPPEDNAVTPSGSHHFAVSERENYTIIYDKDVEIQQRNGFMTPRRRTVQEVIVKKIKNVRDYEIEASVLKILSDNGVLVHPYMAKIYGKTADAIIMDQYDALEADFDGELAMDPKSARKLAKQFLDFTEFLLNKNIRHNDSKLDNCMVDQDGDLKVIDIGYMNQNDADDLGLMEYDFSKRPMIYDTSLGVPYPAKMQAKHILNMIIHADHASEKPVVLQNNPVCNIEDFYFGDIGHSQRVKPMIERIKLLEEKLLICHCIKALGQKEATELLEDHFTDPLFRGDFQKISDKSKMREYMKDLAYQIRTEFSKLKKQVDRDFVKDLAKEH